MTADIAAAKADLRKAMKARRAAIPASDAGEAAIAILQHRARLVALRPPGILAAFMPIGSEIDPRPLMAALAAAGWKLALPRVEGDHLAFRAHDPAVPLTAGGFGLSEPVADAALLRPDMLLVPLLAFDRQGNRLGYGRGYYDRALQALPDAIAIGIGFAIQQYDAVPVTSRDHPLHAVITERAWIDCRR